MLSFEFDELQELLCIHVDEDGLRKLSARILKLIDQTPNDHFDHTHFMTPNWGGSELSDESKSLAAMKINHVKLYCWKGNKSTI